MVGLAERPPPLPADGRFLLLVGLHTVAGQPSPTEHSIVSSLVQVNCCSLLLQTASRDRAENSKEHAQIE